MARSRTLLPLLVGLGSLTLASACGDPATIDGNVLDIWNRPVVGATVVLEGVKDQVTTGESGAFSFPAPAGEARLMAGKDGYIKDMMTVSAPDPDAEKPATVKFKLYKDPGAVGFYAVGKTDYVELPAFEAQTKGTEIRAVTGISDVGSVAMAADEAPRFVFSSSLRAERLAQLDLQLVPLSFVQEATLPGVLGETTSDINLWTSKGNEIDFDLVVLPSRDDFLFKLREPLPKGAYAFHTMGALSSKDFNSLDKLPKELRRVYPFEVK